MRVMSDFNIIAQNIGQFIDMVGVAIILIGIIASTIAAVFKLAQNSAHKLYKSYRNNLARSILLGLEFLIAGDIIRSVTGDITLEGVIILGIIVIIRTIISMEFELEINGRWPWQQGKKKA